MKARARLYEMYKPDRANTIKGVDEMVLCLNGLVCHEHLNVLSNGKCWKHILLR